MSLEAHIENGQIILDTPVQLPDGARLRIEIVSNGTQTPTLMDRMRTLAGRAKHLPPDAAAEHDHYLYGTPKRS